MKPIHELEDGFQMGRAFEMFPPTSTWELSAGLNGKTEDELLHEALVQRVSLHVIDMKGKKGEQDVRKKVLTIPGHVWGTGYGLKHADVMIIGKRPGDEEDATGFNLIGNSGRALKEAFSANGLTWQSIFVTNVVQFLPPDGGTSLRAYHIKDCAPLLAQQLIAVSPKYILLLGSDALKFMYGKKASMSALRGAVMPYTWGEIGKLPQQESTNLSIVTGESKPKVMATIHPAYMLREPSLKAGFEKDIQHFCEIVIGRRSTVIPVDQINDYRYIHDVETLKALVDELIAAGKTEFAIDCEWGGSHFKNGYLRTIQFSWAVGKAAVVILRTAESGSKPTFKPNIVAAVEELRRLIDRPGVHLYGQYIRSDALWLEDIGLPVMKHFAFDTMLADHIINENWEHNLSALAIRYTTMGRYDFDLQRWLKLYPQGKAVGFANVPDRILHPYAAADADAVFRIVPILREWLQRAEHGDLLWLYENVIHPANYPIHEMEKTGVLIDTDRMIDLLWRYNAKKQAILQELRELIHWPSFNPRSSHQKVRLLFGPVQSGMLGMRPVKSTGKPAMTWDEVLKLPDDERAKKSPSTDAESLELLWIDAPNDYSRKVVTLLEHFQIIDQVTKNFLRPPDGHDTEATLDEEFDRRAYTSGLLGHVADDGRIRTTFSQLKETGRYGSSRPNLQNISKRQEPRYQEIMGDIPAIRSCIIASPGYVLVESDYKSAELDVLAHLSGDPQLIADVRGPVKLHAKVAVDILGAPTTYDKVSKEFPHLYVGAKAINFGIPYKRGARAIARQVNRETKGAANMSPDEAQGIIDSWYNRYARVRPCYMNLCERAVRHKPHYLPNPYGRRRRFYEVSSESVMTAQEREAVNFPIQSTVAETLSRALFNLWEYRRQHPEHDYRIVLAIHDAVLFEVAVPILEPFVEEILPMCMTHGAVVPSCSYFKSQAFALEIDTEVMLRWGEKPDREELAALRVPERYLPEQT